MPGREDDARFVCDLEERCAEANADVVVRGDSSDLRDAEGGAELLCTDVGEPDVPDQALRPHFRERRDLILERHVGRGWGVQ